MPIVVTCHLLLLLLLLLLLFCYFSALFDCVDVDKDGIISFEELKNFFDKYPDIIDNLTIRKTNK